MSRLFYEKSVCYKGHLIIPFVFSRINSQSIYSYKLLSELGRKGKFHKAENPAGIYSSNLDEIISIAIEHLDREGDAIENFDLFKIRYTYRDNLIIIAHVSGKYFYDHYPPDALNNIAAPKVFRSELECIKWVKQGLDRSHSNQSV
jgi:hypothetical protein